ncbi:MAG: PIN domain-containing protein [Caldilineales bacterium]|nr:PIN domain-containing protein [Caldilineales bacterium]
MALDRIFRVIGLILFGIIGWQIGILITQTPNPLTDLRSLRYVIPLTLLGAVIGWFIAPYITTRPAMFAIRLVRNIPIEEVVSAAIGLALGLLIAALLAIPLSQLPDPFGSILPFVGSIIFGYLGAMIAVLRGEDMVRLLGRVRRGGDRTQEEPQSGIRPVLLDTSVIIDGRIADVARTGFLVGPLIVTRFVLAELQYIADSPDQLRRVRGRRGLEVLDDLQGLESPSLEISDMDVPGVREVDEKLMALARRHGYAIVTNDYNLNRVAMLQGITVLNLNDLANAMKSILLPGESLSLLVIQEGKELDQGVGYLDDGTMVVVEGGSRYIGHKADLTVTKVLQTSAGRMIFAVPN